MILFLMMIRSPLSAEGPCYAIAARVGEVPLVILAALTDLRGDLERVYAAI